MPPRPLTFGETRSGKHISKVCQHSVVALVEVALQPPSRRPAANNGQAGCDTNKHARVNPDMFGSVADIGDIYVGMEG